MGRRRQDETNVNVNAGIARASATAWDAAGTVAMVAGTAVPYAVSSDAFAVGTAVHLTDLERGALEYNLARTGGRSFQLETPFQGDREPVLVLPDPDAPLAPNTMRVVAVLQGAWVANSDDGCKPFQGEHPTGCSHAANVTPFTRRSLAMATFGHGGGSQLTQVTDALNEAAANTTEIFVAGEGGTWFRQVSHVLSLREVGRTPEYALPGDLPLDATGYLSWDPFLHRSLMAGHFQTIPMDLVRDLSGTDFMVWVAVLSQRPTGSLVRHGKVGETREYSVTGRDATLSVARLGMGRKRADKLRAALVRAAENGNPLVRDHLGLELHVEDRTGRHRGLKLTLTKVTNAAVLGGEPTAELDVPHGTIGRNRAAGMDATSGKNGRTARQKRTRSVRETVAVDRLETGSETGLETRRRRTLSSEPTTMDELATLLRQVQGWKTVNATVRERLWDWSQVFATDDDPAAGYRQLARWIVEADDPKGAYGYLTERVRSWRQDRKTATRQDDPTRDDATETLRRIRDRVATTPHVQVDQVEPVDPTPAAPVQDDDETPEQRGRRAAIVAIRSGLPAGIAASLRDRHNLTDDDLKG